MPHVSKKKLNQKIFEEIHRSFCRALFKSSRANALNFFTGSFFTKTEKIMLAKRLAIIALIHKGMPFNDIERLLKVSPSTINRFKVQLDMGRYKTLLKILNVKTKEEAFWDALGKILRGGLPPIVGKGRWDFLNK